VSRKLGSKLERTKQDTKLTAGEPVKPSHFTARASAEWDRIISELSASGLTLTPAHRGLVALAATLSADIRSCWERVATDGEYVKGGSGGLKPHPALQRMDLLRRDLAKVLASLGLQKPSPEDLTPKGPTLEDVLNGV
jgi:P27 family predicted phage terminase small subunit